jgi:cell envelope opacity-associated protein A
MVVRFIRNASGTVESLAVDAGRVRNIRFVRR